MGAKIFQDCSFIRISFQYSILEITNERHKLLWKQCILCRQHTPLPSQANHSVSVIKWTTSEQSEDGEVPTNGAPWWRLGFHEWLRNHPGPQRPWPLDTEKDRVLVYSLSWHMSKNPNPNPKTIARSQKI